ncbi:type I-F CRISPR-associated protein Csy2 [Spirochaeta africana]|uniref:CRISPR type I-F/YPEST-associated protein Csy2 n=1 Tax=Spirochaeta africana (strain ATCC 700263 / DSM 8902 / Z-7692) TaxID=889378 RepID=H9UG68_SPIAZ|nr:type I-F CRISPR-associated protein Csy2 [Spirochaeta africana]AFG36511.1 CRISPR type I-F/YPEST-associated protein Csy2 [Spirochaeta africana DSM 8902]
MKRLLIIPHLIVQNANAQSSPYTLGFPAMTAFLGATHAFQRILSKQYPEFQVKSTGVVCHNMELRTHKGYGDFVHSVINTANPITKDGKRPSFIEEPKCSLDITLIMEVDGMPLGSEEHKFQKTASEVLDSKMRIAGGDILAYQPMIYQSVDSEDPVTLSRFKRLLMPGYVLVERRDLMIQEMQDGNDALDALLNCMKIDHSCEQSEDGTVEWQSKRKYPGWLVPVAVGYQGVSELGRVSRQRDPTVQHRFAEAIVTLGEFVMPYRLKKVDSLLWHYESDQEKGLYFCTQTNNQK